jgi:hypothetical protein
MKQLNKLWKKNIRHVSLIYLYRISKTKLSFSLIQHVLFWTKIISFLNFIHLDWNLHSTAIALPRAFNISQSLARVALSAPTRTTFSTTTYFTSTTRRTASSTTTSTTRTTSSITTSLQRQDLSDRGGEKNQCFERVCLIQSDKHSRRHKQISSPFKRFYSCCYAVLFVQKFTYFRNNKSLFRE